jgi:O-acetyl-ADP-ribose deacetylase (regulator of RNase III)
MRHCAINNLAKIAKWRSVAFPLIGTGLGGGRWDVISAIIEANAKDFQPIVYSLDGVVPA